MLLRTLPLAALLIVVLSTSTATQNASSILAASSKAMGVDTLNSITYSGTARNGAPSVRARPSATPWARST